MTEEHDTDHDTIDALMDEQRHFPPSAAFKEQALLVDTSLYDEGDADYQGFWARQAAELLDWTHRVAHHLRVGAARSRSGSSAASSTSAYNCLDRHVLAGRGDKVAFHWEGEPGDTPHHHLRRSARRGAAVRQRAQGPRRASAATGSTSTCR